MTLHERVARLPEWTLREVIDGYSYTKFYTPEGWVYDTDGDGFTVDRRDGTPVYHLDVEERDWIDDNDERLAQFEAIAADWRSARAAAGIDNDTDEWKGGKP